MRPKISLADRIAKHTGMSAENVQYTLDHPESGAGVCWTWTGMTQGHTPMMKYEGRIQTTRRVLLLVVHGELPVRVNVKQPCGDPVCVNPNHSVIAGVTMAHLADPYATVVDDEPLTDVVDSIYSRDQPWDAAQLASDFGYPLEKVELAISLIESGAY